MSLPAPNFHSLYHKALYLLLIFIIVIPPFIFDIPSRKFNNVIGILELLFILSFLPYAYLVKVRLPAVSKTTLTLLVAMAGFILMSVIFAVDSYWGWRRGLLVFVHIMFFVVVYLYMTTEETAGGYLFYSVPIGFLLVSVPLIINVMATENPANHCWWSCFHKTIGFYAHIRHTNYHNFLAIVFLFVLFLRPARMSLPFFIVFLLVLFLFVSILLWSGGRGALLALTISMLSMLILTQNRKKVIKLFSMLVITSLLSVITLKAIGQDYLISRASDAVSDLMGLVVNPISNTNIVENEQIVTAPEENLPVIVSPEVLAKGPHESTENLMEKLNMISSDRLNLWKGVIVALYLEEKWLFGFGPEGYRSIKPRLQGTQPHNLFLQAVIEWGLFGAFVFVWLLAKAYVYSFKQLKDENDPAEYEKRVISISFITGMLVFSMYDGVFYHAIPVLIFCIALAYSVSPPKYKQV